MPNTLKIILTFLTISWLCGLTTVAAQQGFEIFVYDGTTGEELIGAEATNADFTWQEVTDIDGKVFMPNLSFNEKITFTYLGYSDLTLEVFRIRDLKGRIAMSEDAEVLDVVEVVGRRDEDPVEIPYTVSVVKAKEIEFKNSQTAADALGANAEVFIQKSQFGGGSPVIRGFEANKVLLVLDGVRLNNAIYRNGHLQNAITIDNAVMDQIEVLYGPGSLTYGSDALGGVVHFRTKDPEIAYTTTKGENVVKTNMMTRHATASNEISYHFDVNFGLKNFASLTAVSRSWFGDLRAGRNRDETYPDFGLRQFYVQERKGDVGDQVIRNPDPSIQVGSGYGQLDIMQKFKYQPNDHFYLVANYQFSANDDVPRYDRITDTLNRADRLKFAMWEYGQQRMLASLKARTLKPNKLWDAASFIYGFQRVDEDRFNRKFGSNRMSYNQERVNIHTLTADMEKNMDEAGIHKLTYGIDANHNDVLSVAGKYNVINESRSGGRLTRYPSGGGQQLQFGGYVDYRWRTQDSSFNFRAGVRYSNITLDVNYTDRDIIVWPDNYYEGIRANNDNISYAAALTYNGKQGTQARAIYSSAFRSPNIDDFAKIREKNGRVTIPNPTLQPELAPMNVELTLAHQLGTIKPGADGQGVKISGTAFYTLLEDAIIRQDFLLPNGQDYLLVDGDTTSTQANINARRATIMGVSGNIVAQWNRHWSAMASYNWIEGEVDGEEGKQVLSHIPPTYGRASLKYQNDKLQIEGLVSFNGAKPWEDYAFNESDNESEAIYGVGTPAWMTYNIYAAYKVNDRFKVNIAAENLTDLHYRPFSSGISAAGRNIIVSLRGSF